MLYKMQIQNIIAIKRKPEDLLNAKEKNIHRGIYGTGFTSNKISVIILAIINFCFIIGSFVTLIKNNEYYLELSEDVCTKKSFSTFTDFWCNIGDYETNIISSYFVFIILFMSFQLFSILIHKDVAKLEIKGILYYILIGIDSIFLILFYIYLPLFFFLCAYSIIVLSTNPIEIKSYNYYRNNTTESDYIYNNYNGNRTKFDSEGKWNSNKTYSIVNSILIFFIFLFDIILLARIKLILILYLNMRFENMPDDKMRKTTMKINNNDVEFKVRADKIFYLHSNDNKTYKFKEVIIKQKEGENEREDIVYANLDNELFDNLFSFSSFDYPELNKIFEKMAKIAEIIFGILFLSVPLSKFHINNELNYILFSNINPINKPEFYNIFNFYGDFEKRITDSRIILYSISLFFFLLFMLKRIIFGGFNNNILLTISYALCIIFILENIIYTIISFLGTLFGIFSIVCYFDLIFIHDGLLIAKLFCLIILHFIIFCLVFALIIHSCKLSSMINIIRGQLKLLNENRDNTSINKLIFTYKGFDSKDYILEEKEMPGYPRNVFFSKKEVANNPQINNQQIMIDQTNQLNQNNQNNQNIGIGMEDPIVLNINKNNNLNNNEGMKENIDLNNNHNSAQNINQNN